MSFVTTGVASSVTAYREGKILVVPAGASLPAHCVKCGAPATGRWVTKTFRWHASWIYFLILIAVLIYAIVAVIVQKKMRLSVPFCSEHRVWRTRMNMLATILLVGCIPISILLGYLNVDGGWIVLLGALMFLGGLVVLAIVGSSFTPVFINEVEGRFKGAGEEFLAKLPTQLQRA